MLRCYDWSLCSWSLYLPPQPDQLHSVLGFLQTIKTNFAKETSSLLTETYNAPLCVNELYLYLNRDRRSEKSDSHDFITFVLDFKNNKRSPYLDSSFPFWKVYYMEIPLSFFTSFLQYISTVATGIQIPDFSHTRLTY